MKLIFVNRYFHPDHSATAQLLSDVVPFPASEICQRRNLQPIFMFRNDCYGLMQRYEADLDPRSGKEREGNLSAVRFLESQKLGGPDMASAATQVRAPKFAQSKQAVTEVQLGLSG